MEKNIRKIRLTSPVWEYQRVADICNEQSKEGFQLDKISVLGKSTFKQDTSKKYVYAIDYNTVILKNNQDKEKYLEMFTEQGWEFVDNTFNGFVIFRKEYTENFTKEEYRIYTDKESSEELCERIARIIKIVIKSFIISCFMVITGFLILILVSETEAEKIQILEFGAMFLLIIIICWLPLVLFFNQGLKKLKKF